ncbi:unnamed protein product [Spirodela intermedia]|uniref:Uncharacterized protein n=1 Tax=Spirodela intermedia TaxID=51605 RepID=A0A7I8IR20_SPIIN|nr:unnamed protein product [Spirodela intermedia]CAA6660419.1 unnamed protein product [Spirodela intermedia]
MICDMPYLSLRTIRSFVHETSITS